MKILINTGRFNGGAPLSILEYGKIAKKYGHDVVAVGEYKTIEKRYLEANIKTYDVPYFSTRRIVRNFKSLNKLAKVIKIEKPDLIHATSYGIVPSKFFGLLYGLPVMYSIAGGKTTNRLLKGEKLIVYSQENKEDLISQGYKGSDIIVVSNRISGLTQNFDKKVYTEQNENIRLLIISRLDAGVIKSVINVMELVKEFIHTYPNIVLDIIGSGELFHNVQKRASDINRDAKKKIINVWGHVYNVQDYIRNSHIVFGKGRSIIEAVLNYRLAFVIGEDNSISLCEQKSISNLYKYNFSGRNISNKMSRDDILSVIRGIKEGTVNYNEIISTRNKVDELYNVDHAEEIIMTFYNEYNNEYSYANSKPSLVKACIFMIKTYVFEVVNIKKWKYKINGIKLKVFN